MCSSRSPVEEKKRWKKRKHGTKGCHVSAMRIFVTSLLKLLLFHAENNKGINFSRKIFTWFMGGSSRGGESVKDALSGVFAFPMTLYFIKTSKNKLRTFSLCRGSCAGCDILWSNLQRNWRTPKFLNSWILICTVLIYALLARKVIKLLWNINFHWFDVSAWLLNDAIYLTLAAVFMGQFFIHFQNMLMMM